jgi:hypothetical protein
VGETFTDDDSGIIVMVDRYFPDPTTPAVTTGDATIENDTSAGGLGQEVHARVSCLSFEFPQFPVSEVTLRFFVSGAWTNIEVNGDLRIVQGFDEIDGIDIRGVHVTLDHPDPGSAGELKLEGRIRTFSIGCEDLNVDDVCFVA